MNFAAIKTLFDEKLTTLKDFIKENEKQKDTSL